MVCKPTAQLLDWLHTVCKNIQYHLQHVFLQYVTSDQILDSGRPGNKASKYTGSRVYNHRTCNIAQVAIQSENTRRYPGVSFRLDCHLCYVVEEESIIVMQLYSRFVQL